jgi:hypothetical protein
MDHGGFDGLVVETGQCGKCFFRRLRSAERNGVASLELPTSVLAGVRCCAGLPQPAPSSLPGRCGIKNARATCLVW